MEFFAPCQQNPKPPPNRYSNQKQPHARRRVVNLLTLLYPRKIIPTDQDIELIIIIIINIGTFRDLGFRQRDRHIRDWRLSTHRPDQPPSDSRASRTLYAAYHNVPSSYMSLHGKHTLDQPQCPPNDVRATTSTSGTPSPGHCDNRADVFLNDSW